MTDKEGTALIAKLVNDYDLGKIKAKIDMAQSDPSKEKNKDQLRIVLESQKTCKLATSEKLSAFRELIDEFKKAIGKYEVHSDKGMLPWAIWIASFKAEAWPRVKNLLKKTFKIPYGLDGDMMKNENKDEYFTKEARVQYLGFKD